MIIFSQGPTQHSRLANSLVWMSKIQGIIDRTGQNCSFPWAIENFGNFLEKNSFWMMKNSAYDLFYSHTSKELTAANLSQISRTIEHNYEVKNNLRAFECDHMVTFSDEFSCLFISGSVDVTDDKNISLINESKLVLIHEPFNLKYLNPISSNLDYKNILPKKDLLLEQTNYINAISSDKRKIGLHIRRGDYNLWQDGLYFYDDYFWLSKVKELNSLNNAVYIFTNEVNPIFHNELNALGAHVSNASFEIDFVRMILMNEIYGPPSTFSGMAVNIAKTCFNFDAMLHYLPAKN